MSTCRPAGGLLAVVAVDAQLEEADRNVLSHRELLVRRIARARGVDDVRPVAAVVEDRLDGVRLTDLVRRPHVMSARGPVEDRQPVAARPLIVPLCRVQIN